MPRQEIAGGAQEAPVPGLDDWEKGYSIHQIDPDTMFSSDSPRADRDLPEPATFRFVAAADRDTRFFAMGSNIVVVSSGGGTESPTLVYDTAAAALAIGPPLPVDLAGPIFFVPGGDALYALTTLGAGLPLAFESFSWSPCTSDVDAPWPLRNHEWSWKSVDAAPPPFNSGRRSVVAYAAHPDGRTVFVSTSDAAHRGGAEGTFSFDAERREWTRHGAWALPFRGQGHYDRELDAWVGLDEKEPGRVCACQVASRAACTARPPESDRMEEKLFRAGGGESTGAAEATLTYMGDSKFCLVESVVREDAAEEMGGYERVVRVTTFGLKFDRKGKLKTTSHWKTGSFVAPKYVPFFSPVAFWM